MASPARTNVKHIAPVEHQSSDDAVARPEELRLLEALLFASTEPLDEASLAKRMPEGVNVKEALAQLQADYAMRGVNLVSRRQQVDLPYRGRSRLADDPRNAPRRAGCRAPPSRCWRSSPITSR